MEQTRPGQIVSFWSYSGGTGRTMATANVAWILAAAGQKVLVVDWNLEAPGLHRFLQPFLDSGSMVRNAGVGDVLRDYEDRIVHDGAYADDLTRRLAVVTRHATEAEWPFRGAGQLNILWAGRQNANYAALPGARGWTDFFEEHNGADFLDAVRDDMRASYDYTLIDSPAGCGDVVDMCTQHLPDVLVTGYSLSNRAIDGAARTAHSVESFARRGEPGRAIRILPVAMRVDASFPAKAEAGMRIAEEAFSGFPQGMSQAERRRYFTATAIPYRGEYAFEEVLATFGDPPGNPTSLLAAYERLTGAITSGRVTSFPAMNGNVRLEALRQFDRAARWAEIATAARYRSN